MTYFLLDGREIYPVHLLKWAMWFEHAPDDERTISYTELGYGDVSTVFVGMEGRLFETLVTRYSPDPEQEKPENEIERYDTYNDAEAGHARWLEALKTEHEEGQKALTKWLLDEGLIPSDYADIPEIEL